MKAGICRAILVLLLLSVLLSASATAQAICAVQPDDPSCKPKTVPGPDDGSKVGQAKVVPQVPKTQDGPGVLDAIGAFFASVGHGIGTGAGAVGHGAVAAVKGLGAALRFVVRPLAVLLASLQPAWMSAPLYASTVSAGTGAAVFGAQYGGWQAWRRLFPLGTGVLGLFSRIDKSELLENDRRARIFDLIKTNPGIHLSEIARELDFAWGTTLHHLRKLRADHLIMFKALGHHKSFFINGSGYSEKQMEAMSLIKNGTLSKLASYLEEHPRVSLKELSEALQISPPLAAFHIRKLEKAGLVQKVRDGKSVRLSIAQALPLGFMKNLASQADAVPQPMDAAS